MLVVVDEMSMLSAEFLALLDKRMRQLYNADQTYGDMSILLSGDFLQMKCVFGTDLCDALYSPFQPTQQRAKALFTEFSIFQMTAQVRAHCKLQQECLEDFRATPKHYPTGLT